MIYCLYVASFSLSWLALFIRVLTKLIFWVDLGLALTPKSLRWNRKDPEHRMTVLSALKIPSNDVNSIIVCLEAASTYYCCYEHYTIVQDDI